MTPRRTTTAAETDHTDGVDLEAMVAAELARSEAVPAPVVIETGGSLARLIDALRAAGCTVSRADDYFERLAVANLETPPEPPSVLDLPTQDWTRHLRDWAAVVAGRNAAMYRLSDMRKQLDAEMSASMAAEADDYLEVLRGPFTRAAAHARLVRELGISPETSAEHVMAKGGRASEAWISFRGLGESTPVRVLARVATIRAQLAELTGAGEGPGADHAIGVTWPYQPEALKVKPRGEHAATKWLRAAPALDLVPFSELRQIDIMRAQGHDTEALVQQATAQRARAKAAAAQNSPEPTPAPVSA